MLWQISFRLRDQMLLMLCTATTMKWHLELYRQLKDAGLTPGEDIQVVGIDGQKEAWELVKSGEMLGTVQCSPKHGPTVFEVIQKILDGETVQKETIVPDQVITKENVDESESLVF